MKRINKIKNNLKSMIHHKEYKKEKQLNLNKERKNNYGRKYKKRYRKFKRYKITY